MKNLLASLMFFTRLPWWRLGEVPPECFRRVVEYWPLTGWLTGGVMALVWWLAAPLFGAFTAAILAIASRLLLTGCLHEDGLADFFDGMGGGNSRERILEIMKDSHIGTYGVVALIIYFMLAAGAVSSLPVAAGAFVLLAADPWSKFCASQVVSFLPYARKAEQAKNLTVYARPGFVALSLSLISGALPLCLLPAELLWAAVAPVPVCALAIVVMRKRLAGYTGDCCGATFLLCELSFLLVASALSRCIGVYV